MITLAPLLVGGFVAAGYGQWYEGPMAVAITAVGSVVAAAIVAALSIFVLRGFENALLIRERALGHTRNGVMITDHLHPDEPITYVNRAFTEITGYAEEQVLGRNARFLNVGVSSNEESALETIRDSLRFDQPCTVELLNQREDKSIFWNRLSLAPVFNHRGEATHFIGVLDDISEGKDFETQLEHALGEAEKANAMRDAFVRLISHELRTPLNSALTWLRLMQMDERDETRDRAIAVIGESIESQSRLIEDLVEVTTLSVSGVRLEPEPIDLAKLVEAVVTEQKPAIIEAGKTIDVNVTPGDYSMVVDPLRMQQIVRNLVTNANKYTPKSGAIDVRLEGTEETVTLIVSDTGKGLTGEQADQVFEPFWRASSNTPGLGIGLAIVASLVEAHGGAIRVSSLGLDQGAQFTVTLTRHVDLSERAPIAPTRLD